MSSQTQFTYPWIHVDKKQKTAVAAEVSSANNGGLVMRRGWSQSATIIGSAYLELGQSKVAAYVFAPRAATGRNVDFEKGSLECELSFASHLAEEVDIYDDLHAEDGVDSIISRYSTAIIDALSASIRLSAYPKTVITISAVVFQSSVQDLSALINAVSLALADATIEMKDLVTSYTLVQEEPTSSSGDNNKPNDSKQLTCTIACLANFGEISFLNYTGQRNALDTMQILTIGKSQCEVIRERMSTVLKESST